MPIPVPDIQKFIPLWVCFTCVAASLAAFLALLIVLATSSRRRDEESK